jgi:hypothetical protein
LMTSIYPGNVHEAFSKLSKRPILTTIANK